MMSSRVSIGATIVWTLAAVTAAMSALLVALDPERNLHGDTFGGLGGLSFVLLALAFATVGAIIATRVPGNGVGRIFLGIGLLAGAGVLAYEYAAYALTRPAGAPGKALAASLSSPATESLAALLGLALLLFPDGRLPSRRWRAAVVVSIAGMILLVVSGALLPGALDDPFGALTNPIGIRGTRGALTAADSAGWILAVAGMSLGAAATLVRLRRARGDERQQLRLVLTVGTIIAAVTTLDMLSWFIWPNGALQIRMAVIGVSFAAFAVAIGVAMLRYRLYDVDLLVDRTLVYGSLTLFLAGAYAATTLTLATALGSGSTWATAGSALVVAVAARPLRDRLQDTVDRRFSRSRYEATRRIARFQEDLRIGRVHPEAIETLLQDLVTDPTLELRFFPPDSTLCVNSAGEPVPEDPADARTRTLIERDGVPLAVVLHATPPAENPGALAPLLEAGGLAIEIARLRVALRRQLGEVEASRARIVAAGYAERRKIERDLHDGAQQRLVSIGLEMRHAQHQLDAEPRLQVNETLERAVAELSLAIDELRDLARGLPPSQLDAGLEPALRELASRAPLPVELKTTTERFSASLEAAAYFIACEGLTNSIKHAGATAVILSAARHNGNLVVVVSDDGIGGAVARAGSGLSGLSDRVAAHGGRLHIESQPRAGTTLRAELPCGS
jgi:signal transduction histidine kinase